MASVRVHNACCQVCSKIAGYASEFLQGELKSEDHTIASWTVLEQSAQECGTCEEILNFFTVPEMPEMVEYNERNETVSFRVEIGVTEQFEFIFGLKLAIPGSKRHMKLLPEKSQARESGYHIPVDQSKIDLRQIHEWIRTCDEEHGETCRAVYDSKTLPLPSSMLLIDVNNNCLVELYEKVSYLCLSYVWGPDHNPFQTIKSNIQQLKGSGKIKEIENRLPCTVRDAITLTRELHFQYLWIDRLCIIQDDSIHQDEQIEHMGAIYNNASLTICATDGENAEYGLRGIGHGSTPREYHQRRLRFSSELCFAVYTHQFTEILQTKWHTRGWTFQERVLSPRRLAFNGQIVKWVCRSVLWTEAEHFNKRPRDQQSRDQLIVRRYPSLIDYFEATMSFNNRKLGDDRDGLKAFTGIISVLNKSFPGGFHYGLPECFFDLALLWRNGYETIGNLNNSSRRRYCLPSWSWAGREGAINWKSAEFYYPMTKDVPILQPMVQWRKHSIDGDTFHIRNLYYDWTSYRHNTSKTPPPGWKRIIPDNYILEPSTGQYKRVSPKEGSPKDRVHYVHESRTHEELGYHSTVVLHHPTQTHDAIIPSKHEKWTPFLHGRVQSAFFILKANDYEEDDDDVPWNRVQNHDFNIFNSQDENIGLIYSDYGPSIPHNLDSVHRFIALSKVIGKQAAESFLVDGIEDSENTINVLWVAWKDGIAHRLGVGTTSEQAWLKQMPKEVDIVLG